MMRLRFALAATAILAACATNTIQPDGTRVGTMSAGQLPMVTIDGQTKRLAPGARIFGANNATITPNLVPPNSRVRYRLDSNGQVSQVWLLSPAR